MEHRQLFTHIPCVQGYFFSKPVRKNICFVCVFVRSYHTYPGEIRTCFVFFVFFRSHKAGGNICFVFVFLRSCIPEETICFVFVFVVVVIVFIVLLFYCFCCCFCCFRHVRATAGRMRRIVCGSLTYWRRLWWTTRACWWPSLTLPTSFR